MVCAECVHQRANYVAIILGIISLFYKLFVFSQKELLYGFEILHGLQSKNWIAFSEQKSHTWQCDTPLTSVTPFPVE